MGVVPGRFSGAASLKLDSKLPFFHRKLQSCGPVAGSREFQTLDSLEAHNFMEADHRAAKFSASFSRNGAT